MGISGSTVDAEGYRCTKPRYGDRIHEIKIIMAKKTDFEIPDDLILGHFFEQERRKTLVFLKNRLSISEEDAEDIFQEASINLFNNIHEGKLTELTASLSTYFTAICWRMGCKFVTRHPHITSIEENIQKRGPEIYDSTQIEYVLGLSDSNLSKEQKQSMREIVQDLPSPCEEILWAYYGDNLDMAEISQLIGFKNADSAKAKKSWCMSRLKERFNKIQSLFYDK